MLFIRFLLLNLIAALFTQAAFARNGIYFTLDGGSAYQIGLPSATAVGASSASSSKAPNSSRFGAGYNHDFYAYPALGIGLDIGYGHYGEEIYHYTNDSTQVRSSTLEFLMLLQYHLARFDVFGKVGGLRQTVRITGQDSQPNQTQIASAYALGAAIPANEHMAATLTYERINSHKTIADFSDTQNKSPAVNAYLIGVRYTF